MYYNWKVCDSLGILFLLLFINKNVKNNQKELAFKRKNKNII